MGDVESLSRAELVSLVRRLESRLTVLETENALLRSQLGGPGIPGDQTEAKVPHWVKPNVPKAPAKKKRKKRGQSFVRHRDVPTHTQDHVVDECADCGRKLNGGWVHRTRQIIDLPQVPIQITEHRMIARRCGVCGRRHVPKPDLSGQVLGRSRLGHRLVSLIGHLHTVSRMPLNQIQGLLESLYGLHLGLGSLSGVLHRVAKQGQEEVQSIRHTVRTSPVVHADETGWRQDGHNGFLWSFSTPTERYYTIAPSRGSAVAKEALGEGFPGVLVTDFYSGYSPLLCRHQRCWVHLLRDLKKLRDHHPKSKRIARWVERIRELYDEAVAYRATQLQLDPSQCYQPAKLMARLARRRMKKREIFQRKLQKIIAPHLGSRDSPRRVLAQRMDKFLEELFVFVECPQVPPHNNAAERAFRPAVVCRKVSGGTRSDRGSLTKSSLFTLFGTWALRGHNPLQACNHMLARQT